MKNWRLWVEALAVYLVTRGAIELFALDVGGVALFVVIALVLVYHRPER